MKRWKAVWAAGAAALLLFIPGCGKSSSEDGFYPEVSSIYVTKGGEILSATVEPYEEGNYDSESLEQFIADEVAGYNESLGFSLETGEEQEEVPPVSVNSCRVEDKKLWVVYRYKNSEAFRNFAGEYHDRANQTVSFGTGTALAGREAGWFSEAEFIKLGRGAKVTAAKEKDLDRLEKERMVMVEADHPVILQTEGTILYVTRNIAVLEKNKVQIPEGKHFVIFR